MIKRVQILMDDELFQQLRKYAYEAKTSHCKIIREAFRQFLENNK